MGAVVMGILGNPCFQPSARRQTRSGIGAEEVLLPFKRDPQPSKLIGTQSYSSLLFGQNKLPRELWANLEKHFIEHLA